MAVGDEEGKRVIQVSNPVEDEPEIVETENEAEPSIVIAGESPPPEDEETDEKPWVKDLRRRYREDQKRIRDLEAKVAASEPKAVAKPKPTLADCDYDEEKFETALTEWHGNNRKIEAEKSKESERKAKIQADYDASMQTYRDRRATLGVKDYETAEDNAKSILSTEQMELIIQSADDPAAVVYALGKNSEIARKLASQDNLVKFIAAVAKLETKVEVKTKTPPKPETVVRGSSGVSDRTADAKQLEKLREAADKSGNYTEVVKFKRQMKKRASAKR